MCEVWLVINDDDDVTGEKVSKDFGKMGEDGRLYTVLMIV